MRTYWIWLSQKHMLDREKLAAVSHFGSAEDIYYAADFQGIPGLSQDAQTALRDKDLKEAEKIAARCDTAGIRILTWAEEAYPARLRAIADPPMVLYVRGLLPDFAGNAVIGVVGTRKASVYGLRTARRMGSELAGCGGLVVSGMAEGIDTEATEGALSQGRPAVGILGCGVDVVYPKSNRLLYAQMESSGCLISEFAPGTPAYKWNFPRRNRIISGLSDGVLVVEAPKVSGALITARQALEQGRDVFAVPGNVDVASCEGSNALLKEGAAMAASGWDVLGEYAAVYPDRLHRQAMEKKIQPAAEERIDNLIQLEYSDRDTGSGDDALEKAVLRTLAAGRMHVDALVEATGLTSSQLLPALTMLEMKGQILTQPGGWISRI